MLVTAALALGLFVGCSPAGKGPDGTLTAPPNGVPDAMPVAAQVAEAIPKLSLADVPLTTSVEDATKDLQTIFAGMDDLVPAVTVAGVTYEADGKTATATLSHSLPVGEQPWTFESKLPLSNVDGAWQAVWSASVVHPQLTSETRLRHRRTQPRRSAINDRAGQALVEERNLYQLGLDKSKVDQARWAEAAKQLAGVLGIDAAEFVAKVNAGGPKQFVVGKTVRQEEIPPAVTNVPGGTVTEVKSMLAPSDTFAVGLLGKVGAPSAEQIAESGGALATSDLVGVSGLQQRYDKQLRGVAGVQIDQVGRQGIEFKEVALFTQEPSIGAPIDLSLDRQLQEKAESVLASSHPSDVAALVVIDLKDGGVLAAANSPAVGEYPQATYGSFAPGSTFKVVTSLAMIRKGITADSAVECSDSLTIGDYTMHNYPGYPADHLGSIPLKEAAAYSCNTAFGRNYQTISRDELKAAAGSLGVGTDYDAGFTSNFGTVEPNSSQVDQAASMIGQGGIRMSPLGMASVAASVASGRTVVPWLVKGQQATSTASPLTDSETSNLQEVMKAVVQKDPNSGLAKIMTGAKTGTAEFGQSAGTTDTAHAWMIAWNDKYAVAAFVEKGDSGSGTAQPLIEQLFS